MRECPIATGKVLSDISAYEISSINGACEATGVAMTSDNIFRDSTLTTEPQ